jgi:hypothetical protein
MQALPASAFTIMREKYRSIANFIPHLYPLDLNVDPIPLFWRDWRE